MMRKLGLAQTQKERAIFEIKNRIGKGKSAPSCGFSEITIL